jgi:hypothetical protein
MDKQQAIKYLYQDWLDYKNYYFKIGFEMKESFIEYLEREVPDYIESEDQCNNEWEGE